MCAILAWPQRPAEEDATAAIERSRRKALDYARTLPDFVCTEVIRRYTDMRGRGLWLPLDTLTIKLSYFEQKEEHKLVLINDKPTDRLYSTLDGAIGVGEFGGTLHGIFDPASKAEFHWQSWKTVRKHRVAVYSYVVEPGNSNYTIATGEHENLRSAVVGFHGLLEIDAETGSVLHFNYIADHISKEVRVEYAETTVDYDFADVGGRNYLLPARSETQMRSPGLSTRNAMEFHGYGKFASDSTISFGDGK